MAKPAARLPLDSAIWSSEVRKVVGRLEREGARVDAFHLAAEVGHVGLVMELARTTGVNTADSSSNETALHAAAYGGHAFMIALLVSMGAHPNVKNINGVMPLHSAAGGDHGDAVIKLLAAGAEIDGIDNDGRTPLHWAAKHMSLSTARVLLEAGAHIDSDTLKRAQQKDCRVAFIARVHARWQGGGLRRVWITCVVAAGQTAL